MKISKESINILKNFATISNNLRIYPGNELATLSPQQSIFAKATVPDTFPVEVCVYNLNSLLDLLSYMGDQEVEFGEKSLTIKNNGSTFEYRYADPSVIIAPPAGKNIELDNHFEFKLTADDVNMITKAAAITAAEAIIFEAKNGVFAMHVGDKANSMKQSKVLGATDLEFNAVLATENLRVLPESYTVTLSKKKFLHFKSENAQVPQYWLALDPTSAV
jgi:hypothetical protein